MNENELRFYHKFLTAGGLPEFKQVPTTIKHSNVDAEAYKKLSVVKNNILEFVNEHRNLYIGSETTGNGKTTWAINIMLEYVKQIIERYGVGWYDLEEPPAMFVHVPTLLLQAKDFDNGKIPKDYQDKILNAELVIWDDIAVGKSSNYDMQQLLLYIDNRIFNGKSNIFTSNVDGKDDETNEGCKKLAACIGERLASRVWQSSHHVSFKSRDARKKFRP